MSTKYAALSDHLARQKREEISLTFDQIEQIIGTKLPPTSRRSRAFWSNDDSHSTSNVWTSLGYETCLVDLEGGKVTFRPFGHFPLDKEALEALEIGTLCFGRRDERVRMLREALMHGAAAHDHEHAVASFHSMREALKRLGIEHTAEVFPPPSRGRRTREGYGRLSFRTEDLTRRIDLDFQGASVIVQATSTDQVRWAGRTPSTDRSYDAEFFVAMWDTASPYLVTSRAGLDPLVSPVDLVGAFSVRDPADLTTWRRLIRRLLYEIDAFDDAMNKILWRKTPVGFERAIELAGSRLARHAAPDPGRVVRLTEPKPLAMLDLFVRGLMPRPE